MIHRWLVISLALVVASSIVAAQERGVLRTAERLSPYGLAGKVIVAGDHVPAAGVVERFRKLAGDEKASLVAIDTDAKNSELLAAALKGESSLEVKAFVLANRETAEEKSLLEALHSATGVWLASDLQPQDLATLLRDSPCDAALLAERARGGAFAASGSATQIVGPLLAGTDRAAGLDLLPGLVCSADKSVVVRAIDADRNLVGVQLGEHAALLVQGRELHSLGETAVTLHAAQTDIRPAWQLTLESGKRADYVEWRRIALARSQPHYPPPELATAEVKDGSLVIVGGGGLPDDIAKRFIELGGGAEGVFVVLPTAMPDPLPADSGEGFLKKHGAKNVVVLKARDQREVESQENLEQLRKATAIWFGGGRQWHFIDAYEGTKAAELFHDVLCRGGVIGGSSAGATIQGDYLVRGAPAGPHVMMCEGYERGLNFLPGTAIDQHFSQRKRFADMTALMKTYPQFLGIGIDEATALVVQGHVAEILGKGSVHFYDRRQPVVEEPPDYLSVPAGKKYDLKERQVVAEDKSLRD